MAQELEIEFKNMLTSEEFSFLCRKFSLDSSSFFKQINDYFDTPTFALRGKKSALRIRHISGRHDFTLKQPHEDAILETHQWLTDEESLNLIHFGIIPAGSVEQAIARMGIDVDQLIHIGELTTLRAQFPYSSGKLFIDHSYYFEHDDYELEFEAEDRRTGDHLFEELLSECSIPHRPSKNKVLRLYQALQKKGS
ncbi:CYTH domain-containing protein [Sporolactobacillus putidus]|uniref:CYTH domain-containing protein n=1 Tax=Sporolactobacillus putidus TaxID=492735 RepID=A0A917RY50_9BACL|nr:CYTH domain-containing protein [Sporolactobacillus putidus]GGL45627.1 CYTH domain-containing protein [Sporolactobacillus putidus]